MNRFTATIWIIVFTTLMVTDKISAGISVGESDPEKFIRKDSSNFISGWEYHLQQANNGHPFAFSKIWQYGKINSDLGIREDLLMNYDIYRDFLIVQVFRDGRSFQVVLNPVYINSFSIDGHSFVNSRKYTGLESTGINGYVELVYDGKLKYIIKREKKFLESSGLEGSRYEPGMQKFIYKDGRAYRITGRRSVLRIFPDRRREIVKFLRSNGILIKSDDINKMKLLMRFLEGGGEL